MNIFDCIVIGAGPAGTSAAYHLAKQGRSVLILEKAILPRYKPCGGGVSPQIAQWFDFDFSPAISTIVTELCFTWKKNDEAIAEIPAPASIWMVRRDQFDYFLVQKAQSQGATLQQDTKALGINLKQGLWTVQTTKETFQGKYLIAADGGKGVTAKWLGFKARKQYMAGAVEIEPRLEVSHPQRAYFEFGLLKNGYVWNFPKADGYSLGSGVFNGSQRKTKDLLPSLQQYSQQFGVDSTTTQTHGHPLLLWNGVQKLHTEQALLAGEAAAVVDPFTAEGIRPAIFSGVQAAIAVNQALAGDKNALENYSQTMAEWGQEMLWAQRLASLFYRFPQIGYQIGIKSPSGVAKMVQIFTGEMAYSDIIDRVQQKFLPFLGKN